VQLELAIIIFSNNNKFQK